MKKLFFIYLFFLIVIGFLLLFFKIIDSDIIITRESHHKIDNKEKNIIRLNNNDGILYFINNNTFSIAYKKNSTSYEYLDSYPLPNNSVNYFNNLVIYQDLDTVVLDIGCFTFLNKNSVKQYNCSNIVAFKNGQMIFNNKVKFFNKKLLYKDGFYSFISYNNTLLPYYVSFDKSIRYDKIYNYFSEKINNNTQLSREESYYYLLLAVNLKYDISQYNLNIKQKDLINKTNINSLNYEKDLINYLNKITYLEQEYDEIVE